MKIDTNFLIQLFPQDFDGWDRALRRRNWRAGLRFVHRSSGNHLTLLSRHWPHLCCWSWFISFDIDFSARRPFRKSRSGAPLSRTGSIGFWRFAYHWQNFRIASPGPHKSDCENHMLAALSANGMPV